MLEAVSLPAGDSRSDLVRLTRIRHEADIQSALVAWWSGQRARCRTWRQIKRLRATWTSGPGSRAGARRLVQMTLLPLAARRRWRATSTAWKWRSAQFGVGLLGHRMVAHTAPAGRAPAHALAGLLARCRGEH